MLADVGAGILQISFVFGDTLLNHYRQERVLFISNAMRSNALEG
jgi:hypothetical protein